MTEFELRRQKVDRLREMGINPYPSTAEKTIQTAEFLRQFTQLEESGTPQSICGRILLEREHGKLIFFRCVDESGAIQLVVSKESIGDELFSYISEYIDVGDFVQVTGTAFRTKKGEESILVENLILLSKALSPMPDKWHGIQDEEMRYRKRYLDLLGNPELRELFRKKAAFWQATRQFLSERGFLEVETPVLENTTGGADATPFVTHHEALDIDVFLRISMGELWQKRLMIAGFEKTFEIGRQFRNEGISPEHLQDYTQMEMYWAYQNYEAGMALVEEMYKYIVQQAFGTLQLQIRGFDIDLEKTWPHMDYTEEIERQLGINILDASDDALRKACASIGKDPEEGAGRGRMMDMLWKHCRKQIAGPVLLVNHPVEVSPLAKRRVSDPRTVERFQVIIAGTEQGNGYSELNDPIDQHERFAEQARLRAMGDAEAQMNDEEFVEAMEYGMPPVCGFGFSERLFSFLADKSIRECVLFPLLRPKQSSENENGAELTVQNQHTGTTVPNAPLDHDPSIEAFDTGITSEQAGALLKEHLQEDQLLRHSYATGAQMHALAERFGVSNPEGWYIAGLLHDLDYQHHPDITEHGRIGAQLLREVGVNEIICSAIERHNQGNGSAIPQTLLEKALCSAEQLTGLIFACVAVRPDKNIHSLELKSVKKKFKDGSFARGVSREYILRSEEWLQVPLDELIQLTIDAMKTDAKELQISGE